MDEQDYSLDELVRIAHERYGFDPERTRFEFELQFSIYRHDIQQLPDQKYHKAGEFFREVGMMLGFIEIAPQGYARKCRWVYVRNRVSEHIRNALHFK